jgi:hypothetical protein
MPAKYARIPGINVISTVLQNIPIKVKVARSKNIRGIATSFIRGIAATKVAEPRGTKVAKPRGTITKVAKVAIAKITAAAKAIAKIVTASTQVYVLQLQGGFIYVGQSSNVKRRIKQHMDGRGAVFTKRYTPTGILLPRLGNIEGAGDSGERQEVLLQMRMHGMQRVRGWKYVNNSLSVSDVADIRSNWIEMFNLCRICMAEGHMASSCKKRKYTRRK